MYKGSPDLVGKVFEEAVSEASMAGAPYFRPLPVAGDSTVWYLRRKGASLESEPGGVGMKTPATRLPIGIIWLPVRRPDNNPEYDKPFTDTETFAKSVESVANAPPEQRYSMLKGLATSPSEPTATWAVVVLANVDPKGTDVFLRELMGRSDLSLSQRLVVDKVLWQLDREGWRVSPDRLKRFQEWVNLPMAKNDGETLRWSLQMILRYPPFAKEAIAGLVARALANKAFPPGDASGLANDIGMYARDETARQAGFDRLLAIVRESKDASAQWLAASSLRSRYRAEARARREEVEQLIESVHDATLVQLLKEALDVPVGGKRKAK